MITFGVDYNETSATHIEVLQKKGIENYYFRLSEMIEKKFL